MSEIFIQSEAKLSKSQDSAATVGRALASSGLIGGGLAILALQLPEYWRPIAVTLVPTVSYGFTLVVRVLVSEIRRRYARQLWIAERNEVLNYVEQALEASLSALPDMQHKVARRSLKEGIARMQRIKALTLSALPGERPWLSDLRALPTFGHNLI